jgi:hypothetical protein
MVCGTVSALTRWQPSVYVVAWCHERGHCQCARQTVRACVLLALSLFSAQHVWQN